MPWLVGLAHRRVALILAVAAREAGAAPPAAGPRAAASKDAAHHAAGGRGLGLDENLPLCLGVMTTFVGGLVTQSLDGTTEDRSSCDTYAYGNQNWARCDTDLDDAQSLYAYQVCPQCELCHYVPQQCWSTVAVQDASGYECPDGYFHAEWCGVYDDDDFTASVMCCECGGGEVVPMCSNDPVDWTDSMGQGCLTYEVLNWCTRSGAEGPGWAEEDWSSSFNEFPTNGVFATDACCACGGGVLAQATPSPPAWIAEVCEDFVPPGFLEWYDDTGVFFNCFWYSMANRCLTYGFEFARFGHNAQEACCVCGGGVLPCEDTDGRATDKLGGTCEAYVGFPGRCGPFDDSDFTSTAMCCACGSGRVVGSPTPAPPPTPPTPAPTWAAAPCAAGDWGPESWCRPFVAFCDGVEVIVPYLLRDCKEVVSVYIPDSVVQIRERAFERCSSLVSLQIGSSVHTIEAGAFGYTPIAELLLPDSLITLGQAAFFNCHSLAQVVIPDSVQSLGPQAFGNADSLARVVLGVGVTWLQTQTFKECYHLVDVTFGGAEIEIDQQVFQGCYMLRQLALPQTITSIGRQAFHRCLELEHVQMSAAIASLGSGAFQNCEALSALTLSDRLGAILEDTFSECISLSEIELGSEVAMIGARAFQGCASLMRVAMGDAVARIDERAFESCYALVDVRMSGAVTTVGEMAFHRCSALLSVVVPDSVTSVGAVAFDGCRSMQGVTLGRSLSSIGIHAFRDCCSITEVTARSDASLVGIFDCAPVTDMVVVRGPSHKSLLGGCTHLERLSVHSEEVPQHAFAGCERLASLVIGPEVIAIGSAAFKDCPNLTSVALGSAVSAVGLEAFADCSGLQSVSFGPTLQSIGTDAFRGCGSLSAVTIPSPFPGRVRDVFDCSILASVVFNEGVADVEPNILVGCEALASVVLPESLGSIGARAFSGCAHLFEVGWGSRIRTIGSGAFSGCASLGSVTFGGLLESINSSAFSGCTSLATVSIPSSVLSVGSDAFSGCSSLTTVSIAAHLASIQNHTFAGCLTLTDVEIPRSTTLIGDSAFLDCRGMVNMSVPDSVTSIGDFAFKGCASLTAVAVPPSVLTIGDNVFQDCASIVTANVSEVLLAKGMANVFDRCPTLASVVIGGSATSVPSNACKGIASMVSVTIPDYVTDIGQSAFEGCSALSSVRVPQSVTRIGAAAFSGCFSITDAELGASVATIESSAFAGCLSLQKIILPVSVVSIASFAFSDCLALSFMTMPDSLAAIGDAAFSSSALQTLVLPDSIQTFGVGVFAWSPSLLSVHVPEQVLIRGFAATFEGCTGLVTVSLADSVTSVPFNALRGFPTVETVYIPGSVVDIGAGAFENCAALSTAAIPESVTRVGSSAFAGCASLPGVELGGAVRTIGERAFLGCGGMTWASLGDGLILIGASAFQDCTSLESVVIPAKVTEIGDSAFESCSSLSVLGLPSSVTSFGDRTFFGCPVKAATLSQAIVSKENAMSSTFGGCSLGSVVLPNSVTFVSPSAFDGCSAIHHVVAPAAVVNVGMRVTFDGCESLRSVDVLSGAVSLSAFAFRGCSALSNVSIPSSVRDIGESAFEGCAALASIDLPSGLASIGAHAFRGCSSLAEISLPQLISSIGVDAFEGCDSLASATVPASVESTVAFERCDIVKSVKGTSFYTDSARGCVKCPADSLALLEITIACVAAACLVLMLLGFGGAAASSYGGRRSRRAGAAVGLGHSVLLGLQTLQVTTQGVPWPPRLARVLELLNFATLRVDRVQPECQQIAIPILARTVTILYGLPVLLAVCYVGLAFWLSAWRRDNGSLAERVKMGCSAWLLNMHWMAVILLQWSWQWATCGFVTTMIGDQERPILLVGDRMNISCDVAEPAWRQLVSISLPALLVYQIMIPASLLYFVHHPRFSCVAGAYRDDWKRAWLIVDIVFKTVLVICRILFVSKVDEPWVNGRVQMRSLALLLSIACYYTLLVRCLPYRRNVLVAADGALLYSTLATGVTLLCFTVAAPWWIGAERAPAADQQYSSWEEPQDGRSVATESPIVIAIELFLIAIVLMWKAVIAVILVRYSLLARWLSRRAGCCGRRGHELPEDTGTRELSGTEGEAGGRADLGSFSLRARHAIISAPGQTARSFDVVAQTPGEPARAGRLLDDVCGAPPILPQERLFHVMFEDSDAEELVDGRCLQYAGEPEYEFWHLAVNCIESFREYSFACVWIPDLSGCVRTAESFAEWEEQACTGNSLGSQEALRGPPLSDAIWERYQRTLHWIHQSLADAYRDEGQQPECGHCAWFDFWAVNVMRCHEHGQRLRFACLGLPLYDGQPVFCCTSRNTFHYVGRAQRVELEWATTMMGMQVGPVSFQEEMVETGDVQMRMLGNMIMDMAQKSKQNDPVREALYGKLNDFLKAQSVADTRRSQNKLLVSSALALSLALGFLRILAALLEPDQTQRLVTGVVGLCIITGTALCWSRRHALYDRLRMLFSEADEDRADRFSRHVWRHVEVMPAEPPAAERAAVPGRGLGDKVDEAEAELVAP